MKTQFLARLRCNQLFALAALALALALPTAFAQEAPTGPYKIPPLPYAPEALEPHIDAETMRIHHSKHHKAYVDNANKLLADNRTSRNSHQRSFC